ncbi:MAG: nucleotidyltransferase family protein [Candidatus Alkaliphilus sp. MAG34]
MDNKEITEKINRFIDSIIQEYQPTKIILFGSHAKGTNNENSDIDIAIVVDKIEGSFLEKEAQLYKIRRNIDAADIEPILIEQNSDKSGFLDHILSYGKILFAR